MACERCREPELYDFYVCNRAIAHFSISADGTGKAFLRASYCDEDFGFGEELSDELEVFYCPWCGRKLSAQMEGASHSDD